MACRYSSGVRISSPSELPSDRNIIGHLPLKRTDVMFRHSCSLYEKQWRAVYNIGSTRTTPQEKVLFIGMFTPEIRYRHPWLNSSVQHRVECIFAGTGASAPRKSAVREQNFAANNNFGLPRFTRDVGLPQIWHHVCL